MYIHPSVGSRCFLRLRIEIDTRIPRRGLQCGPSRKRRPLRIRVEARLVLQLPASNAQHTKKEGGGVALQQKVGGGGEL